MASQYPVLNNRPIDQWKVTELKEELRRRKIPVRGLKEELVRKLFEAIRTEEMIKEQETGDQVQSDCPDPTLDGDGDQKQAENSAADHTNIVPDPIGQSHCDASAIDINCSDIIPDPVGKTDCDATITDMDINREIKVQDAITATSALDVTVLETQANTVLLEDSATESQTVITQCESRVMVSRTEEKHEEEKQEDSNVPDEDIKPSLSDLDNQVSVVSPDLGFQVKCESIPIDSVSIVEKNKLKDNLNADDFHLEQEVVKPEMVQPSSSSVPSVGGDLQSLGDGKELQSLGDDKDLQLLDDDKDLKSSGDDKEQVKHLVSLEDTYVKSSTNFNLSKEDNIDEGSPEKLNLDRCSSDELMEEDVLESKQIDPNMKSEEVAEKTEVIQEPAVGARANIKDGLLESIPDKKDTVDEDQRKPEGSTEKRKLEDQEAVGSSEPPKRQRRWNSETIKVPEQASNLGTSSTPKDAFQPTPRRIFPKSDSKPSGDTQKERIVPPSQKPATTSLRIDKFLRPFTLKAVQELLAKTGTVCSFWMDHIKTHCYVTYSSVEEANATRNAVYNLQWPPNGGNLLIAEFVDPQEVKARVEAPPQSPAPISPSPTAAKATTNFQPPQAAQPPSRQHSFRQQQLPPPAKPPTPSDAPTVRERLPPPPPPPLPPSSTEPEPPALTLDDLFRKTKASPRIYYLPLSEEEVASRRAAQGRSSSSIMG
ncbi:unnamed protein product [Musa textilis]